MSRNRLIAARLRERADLLELHGGNPFRAAAYRRAGDVVAGHPVDMALLLAREGLSGIDALPGIGPQITRATAEFARTGRWAQLERLRGEMQPERLFTSIPEIGPELARRIHDTPDIDALEELEAATHDGRLAKVPGLGPRRVALLRAALAGLLSRIRPAPERPALQPDVALLLEIDRAYRQKADAGELPRIAEDGRLLGVVPPLALIDVLRREHIEDLHRLAGILRNHSGARDALVDPPFRNVARRLPWLLVGLVGSLVAALLVQRFEGTLEQEVAVAFFMPAIVYLADAIGTQTETMAVRALAAGPMMLGRLLLRELAVGATIGLVLAACAVPLVLVLFARPGLALAVGVALLAAGTVATTIGLLFPWLLARAGRDPAYGAGPVATVVQDLLSLLIYFVCVRLLT